MHINRAIVAAFIIIVVCSSQVYGSPVTLSTWKIMAGESYLDPDECHREADTIVCRKIAILGSRVFSLNLDQYKVITISFSNVEGVSEIDLVLRAISGNARKKIYHSGSIMAGAGARTIRFDLTDDLKWSDVVRAQLFVVLKGKAIRLRDLKVSFEGASLGRRLGIFFETFLHPVLFSGRKPNIVTSPNFLGVPFVIVIGGVWLAGCILLIAFAWLKKRSAARLLLLWSVAVWIFGDVTNKCKSIASIPIMKEIKGGYAGSVGFWQIYASEMSEKLKTFNINRLDWIGDSMSMYYFRFALFPVRVEDEYRYHDAVIFEKNPDIKIRNDSLVVKGRILLEDVERVFDHDKYMIVKGHVP